MGRDALGGATLTSVRLRAKTETLVARLRAREEDDNISWYLHRAPELSAILESAGLDELVLDCDDLDVPGVATALFDIWLSPSPIE